MPTDPPDPDLMIRQAFSLLELRLDEARIVFDRQHGSRDSSPSHRARLMRVAFLSLAMAANRAADDLARSERPRA